MFFSQFHSTQNIFSHFRFFFPNKFDISVLGFVFCIFDCKIILYFAFFAFNGICFFCSVPIIHIHSFHTKTFSTFARIFSRPHFFPTQFYHLTQNIFASMLFLVFRAFQGSFEFQILICRSVRRILKTLFA